MRDATFTTSVRIEASPDEVFPYLINADLLIRWMGDYADLDPVSGGTYAVDINGVPIRGTFLELNPPQRLIFSWGVAGNDDFPVGSTTVEITLTADRGGTLLELAHRDLPADELPKHGIGWAHFLPRLVIAASGNNPGPDPWNAL